MLVRLLTVLSKRFEIVPKEARWALTFSIAKSIYSIEICADIVDDSDRLYWLLLKSKVVHRIGLCKFGLKIALEF
jgi:hypothetical protein